jgi:two-component system, OmpR family, response regulator ResD
MAKPMVLVVDDQPEYARLISLSLAREGYEVRTAGGGEEAVERASELHPDVVLLDIKMPGMDGFEVMAELRGRWWVPIIMVTGDHQPQRRTSGLDLGADDYVTKPFSTGELAARVRAVLRRSGGLHESAARPGLDVAGPRMGRRASRMLQLFRANPQKLLYHDELLAHAFGPAFVGETALLHDEVRRLRRALGVRAGSEGPIRTVKGVGYKFDATVPHVAPEHWSAPSARKAAGQA